MLIKPLYNTVFSSILVSTISPNDVPQLGIRKSSYSSTRTHKQQVCQNSSGIGPSSPKTNQPISIVQSSLFVYYPFPSRNFCIQPNFPSKHFFFNKHQVIFRTRKCLSDYRRDPGSCLFMISATKKRF